MIPQDQFSEQALSHDYPAFVLLPTVSVGIVVLFVLVLLSVIIWPPDSDAALRLRRPASADRAWLPQDK